MQLFCRHDGIENAGGAVRCRVCRACLNCGEKAPGIEFCRNCRIPLTGTLETLVDSRKESAADKRMVSISLGSAPDGLPSRLIIHRGPSSSHLLRPLGKALGSVEQDCGKQFAQIAAQLDARRSKSHEVPCRSRPINIHWPCCSATSLDLCPTVKKCASLYRPCMAQARPWKLSATRVSSCRQTSQEWRSQVRRTGRNSWNVPSASIPRNGSRQFWISPASCGSCSRLHPFEGLLSMASSFGRLELDQDAAEEVPTWILDDGVLLR